MKKQISITISNETLDRIAEVVERDFHGVLKRSQAIEILIKIALDVMERKEGK